MASKNVDVDEVQRKETWTDFLYNSKDGTVLGRTGISWFKITVFYLIFYACLAGWFAGLLHAFYSTLDDIAPRYYGENSLIQDNPALGVRPMPLFDSTMIRYSQGKRSSYRPYTDHLEAFFMTYANVSGAIDCTDGNPDKKACKIDVLSYADSLGCNKENDYGYLAGTPCVALKMNKLYDFKPEAYETEAALKADLFEDEKLGYYSYGPGNVGISCDGQNAVDKQHVHEIKFFPTNGLDKVFFPYLNQVGYRSPIVIAKLNVTKRVTVQVNCRIWALNVDNTDGKEKRGTVHFELYID